MLEQSRDREVKATQRWRFKTNKGNQKQTMDQPGSQKKRSMGKRPPRDRDSS